MMNWTDYIRQLYQLCCDCDIFGADPLMALEVVGMALDRTHAQMTKADEFFTQNVLGHFREQHEAAVRTPARPTEGDA